MRSNRDSLVYPLLLLLSLIFSYLMVVPRYFPHLGVGLTFIVLGALIFGFKKEKRTLDCLIFLIALVLSLFIFFRANSFLTFLNVVTVFYLGSFLILGEEVLEGVLTLVLSPVMVVLQTSSVKNKFSFKTLPIGRISGWLISIILTFAVMVLIVPLLSYANPLFARLVSSLISLFNLREIWERFFQENFVLHILRGLIFLILVYLLPRWLTVVTSKTKKIGQIERESFPISYLIPKLVLTVVLLIFFVTQAQLYLASEETLAVLGYTHSQYAREVFAHLSVVALVVFALIYNDKSKDKWSRGLTYFWFNTDFVLVNPD